MIKQDIKAVSTAVAMLKYSDKPCAAWYLAKAFTNTRSSELRDLIWSLVRVHDMGKEFLAARKQYEERNGEADVPGLRAMFREVGL